MPIEFAGLKEHEVLESRRKFGSNIIQKKKLNILTLLLRQITDNPLIIILTIATVVSFLLNEGTSSIYILWMIVVSVVLGFWNEYSAEKTVETLLSKISHVATVIRDGKRQDIPAGDLVIDDCVFLEPGDIVPADLTIIESKDLEVNESALTGESMPVMKENGDAFMGTIVIGGWAHGRVIKIGAETEYGKIAQNVSFIKPETEFQKGLLKFGSLLVKVILILAVGIFVINFVLGKPPLTSMLFSLAIAVGLTPELLPVIVTISLSHGAGKLAKKHVIAKQLVAIENLGNMDVLCTDKTGTLTEGKITLVDTFPSQDTAILQASLVCNSAITGKKITGNPIDMAIWEYAQKHNIKTNHEFEEVYENPFDYENKAMFTVAKNKGSLVFLAKGAPEEILGFCRNDGQKATQLTKFAELSNDGYRVLAIAYKSVAHKDKYSWQDATDMTFMGFLCFMDTPKKSAKFAIAELHRLNVTVKVLTGDNEIVTRKVAREVGIEVDRVLLGSDVEKMTDAQLLEQVDAVDIFARVSPEQKLRVIAILKKKGHSVGYLGDGVNDIPSLHNADVGISVDTAVDVAKDSANIVLLKKDLHVILDGIVEGRRTFNNTIKYILMSTSSNFGNMFSAAGASAFLPFLPMAPAQILLNNTMYDVSQMSIPSDNVDYESLMKPRHWNIDFIRRFMILFGPISSVFDFATFGLMYWYFKANTGLFQTGWFVESLTTQILVVFVIRTSKIPFFKSTPGKWLTLTCLLVVAAGWLVPFTAFGASLGFVRPPLIFYLVLIVTTGLYLLMVEIAKKIFLKYHVL